MSKSVIDYINSEFEALCLLKTSILYHGFQGALKAFYVLDMIDKKTMDYLTASSVEVYYD